MLDASYRLVDTRQAQPQRLALRQGDVQMWHSGKNAVFPIYFRHDAVNKCRGLNDSGPVGFGASRPCSSVDGRVRQIPRPASDTSLWWYERSQLRQRADTEVHKGPNPKLNVNLLDSM